VFPNSLQDDIPALDGVTALAVGAHLATMNVGMTVGAIGSCVGENGLGMTLGAGYTFVETAKRVPGFVVVKLGNGADGFPACGGMAVLTGYGQVAVRTAGNCGPGLAIAGLAIERTCIAADDQIHGSQENDRRRL